MPSFSKSYLNTLSKINNIRSILFAFAINQQAIDYFFPVVRDKNKHQVNKEKRLSCSGQEAKKIASASAGENRHSAGSAQLDTSISNIRQVISPELAEQMLSDQRQREYLTSVFSANPDKSIRKRAGRIDGCQKSHMFIEGGHEENTKVQLLPYKCNQRFCPSCMRDKSAEYSSRVMEYFDQLPHHRFVALRMKFMTLTVQNIRQETLAENTDNIIKAFRQLRRESPTWKAKVKGYIWNYEVTWNRISATWHPHIHVLYDGEYWSGKSLSHEWSRYVERRRLYADNMNSCNVIKCYKKEHGKKTELHKVYELKSAIAEVTKYTLKPFKSKAAGKKVILELALALHNKRLHGMGGAFWIKPNQDEPYWYNHGGVINAIEDEEHEYWHNKELSFGLNKAIFSNKSAAISLAQSGGRITYIMRASIDEDYYQRKEENNE